MRALGFDLKKAEAQALLREYDRGGEGRITERDFAEAVTARILDRNPMEEIVKAFRLMDDDGTGRISLKNLRRVARCVWAALPPAASSSRRGWASDLGEEVTEDELKAMIAEFDLDQDGESACAVRACSPAVVLTAPVGVLPCRQSTRRSLSPS
jgi:centrin-3